METMMRSAQVLDEAFSRLPELARHVVEGLDPEGLVWQPDGGGNPIGWLVWHLARVQDDHVAELMDAEQRWMGDGWAPRFGLAEGARDTGYGHDDDQVRAVRPASAQVLVDYLDAVTDRTRAWLDTVGDDDLDRVVDTRWDPPVTMGVRLVSVVDDSLQHLGQAGYLRGLHDRTAAD
jgi:hypothetical protein